MEQLPNGYTLHIPETAFPLSTDSMVLSDFVRIGKNENILDLGSGCGTLGLMLCARNSGCHVTGVELDSAAHEAALDNIRRNGLQTRMTSICENICAVNQVFAPGAFTCCISNPPYFSGGEASLKTPLARRDDACTTAQLCQAAAWALQYGGDFYLVHKPENLAQLCACAVRAGLEPKRLRLVRHKPNGSVTLILLQCRKGGRPGLVWEESYLHETDGTPSDYYRKIYHL